MKKTMTPLKAIRAKCLDCCCDSAYEVRLCTSVNCPLYQFRFGKNPNIKLSDERKEQLRQQARKNFNIK